MLPVTNRNLIQVISVFLLFGTLAESAFARRGQRRGFNFGTTVEISAVDDRRFATDSVVRDSQVSTSSQGFTPYVGYAFDGVFNLGAALTLQSVESKQTDHNDESGNESVRTMNSRMKAGSIFARFLFGEVMFLEVGGGLYSETIQVRNDFTSEEGDGVYNGRREEYKVEGMGPGYHGGIGVEIPMGNGFFFTSSYMARIYQLKEIEGDALGSKTGYQQNRELNFGVSHYY